MLSKPIIGYVLKSAVRDRLIATIICILIVGMSITLFMGSSAIMEKDQFTFVFTASALRFIAAMGVVLFTVFYIRRMYERKDVEYLLSRPLSRANFVFSHAVGFIIIATAIAAVVTGVVATMTFSSQPEATLAWSAGLLLELILIAVTAMFFALVLSSPSSATMATMALYVLGRMMGSLLGVAHTEGDILSGGILSTIMEIVSVIVPRYDLLVQSSWLVYGEVTLSWIMVAHAVALMCLYLIASWLDLRRKQF